jgi:hypothetical protein
MKKISVGRRQQNFRKMRSPMPNRNPGATGEIIFASAPVIVLRLNFDFYEL